MNPWNPLGILQSKFAGLYVLGKCLVYLAYLPVSKRALCIRRLDVLAGTWMVNDRRRERP